MARISHVIDGKHVDTADRTGTVYDPATGQPQHEVPLASRAQTDEAIAAAAAALPGWAATSLTKRTDVLFRLRGLLTERRQEIAAVVTSEHGKVLSDAAGEVSRGIENVEFAAGLTNHLKGDFSQQVSSGVDVHSIKQPVGVVGCITPFNFPVMVPLWMIASAIACGNTVVLKPSEKDPSASVLLADLFAEAGLPPGVLNVVHGDKEAVEAHPRQPDRPGRQLRRVHAGRALRLRAGHAPPANGSRPSAARRTTWSCSRTPTSTRPPTQPSRRPTGRPASAAWRSASW